MKHMSPEQISSIVAGSSTSEEEQHCCDCPLCASEVARVREVFSLFRSSLRDWTAQSHPEVLPVARAHFRAWHSLAWALAGTVLAVLIGIPLYQNEQDRQIKIRAEEDALLFESVDGQLSRSAPMAMESLMEMMSGGNNIADKNAKKSNADRKSPTENGGVQ
jgi:hypothetical protein